MWTKGINIREQLPDFNLQNELPTEQLVDHERVNREPNLMETHGQATVEIMGQTMTLAQADAARDKYCPVPREQVSTEANELFHAKLLQKAGHDLPPHKAHLLNPLEAKKSAEQISTSKVVEQHAKAQPLTVVKLPTTTIEKTPAQTISEVAPVAIESKTVEIGEPVVVATSEKVEPVEPAPSMAGGGPDMGGGPEMQSSETQAAEHTPIVQGKPSVAPTVKSEFTIPALTHQRQILSPQSVAGQPERVMPNVSEAVTDILSDVPVAFETIDTTASNPDQQLGDYLSTMLNEAIAETSVIYGLDSSEATDMVQLEPNPNTEAGSGRTEAGVAILNMLSIESSTSDMAEAATDKTPVQELHASLPTVIVELISQPAVDTTAEQLAATSELVETMALIAERLQDLIQTDRADGEEAQQIETVLEAYFDELCVLQGLPANPEERVCFIVRLKQSAHTKAQAAAIRQSAIDEGMRERKHGTHGQSHGIPITELTVYLARFVMGLRGLSLTP